MPRQAECWTRREEHQLEEDVPECTQVEEERTDAHVRDISSRYLSNSVETLEVVPAAGRGVWTCLLDRSAV